MRIRWRTMGLIGAGGVMLFIGTAGVSAMSTGSATSARHATVTQHIEHGVSALSGLIGTAEKPAAPGTIDDGKELLPQAGITLDAAIAAAQSSGNGALGEVDLEFDAGRLVFNVD